MSRQEKKIFHFGFVVWKRMPMREYLLVKADLLFSGFIMQSDQAIFTTPREERSRKVGWKLIKFVYVIQGLNS